MRKENKVVLIEKFKAYIGEYPHLYLTDLGGLDAVKTADLRRACSKANIKLVMAKNTLLRRAMSEVDIDFSPLYASLKGNTAIMFAESASAPAKLIKEFTKDSKGEGKPHLKAAYAEEGFYIGRDQLEALVSIKSREELIGEVITLLQSPIKNVVSSLQSAGQTIHGVLKTLEEK